MRTIRIFLRRYPAIAIAILALTLGLKALVPSGYMLAHGSKSLSLTVTICTGIDAMQKTLIIPVNKASGDIPAHDKSGDSPCAYTALSHALIGGADGILLAIALLFIVAARFAAITPNIATHRQHLRPPLRGPPLFS